MRLRSLTLDGSFSSEVFDKKALGEWRTVPGEDLVDAVQDWHLNNCHGYKLSPDPKKPGLIVWFALIEVEGEEPVMSRVYTSGIVRMGGVSKPGMTIAEIAEKLGWSQDPAELLTVWEGEDPEWH